MSVVQRFHRNEEAQISFLALAATICFVALLAMVINTNDVVEERVHMQDVADATVLSAASWSARGLNLISYINVLNTKLMSTAILLNALNDALPIIIKIAEIQQKVFTACSGVPFIGVFCAVMATVVQIQIGVLRALETVVKSAVNTLSKCPSGALWKIARLLQKGGGLIQKSFVGIAMAESVSIAKANGATFGLVVNGKLISSNPKDGLVLPVKEGKFKPFFCPRMKSGGSGYKLQGYDCGQGPLKLGKERIKKLLLPFINLGAGPIFSGMVSKNMFQLGCTPGPNEKPENVKVQLKSLAECKEFGALAKWSQKYSYTGLITEDSWTVEDFVPWYPKLKNSSGDKDSDDAEALLEGLKDLNPGGGGGGGSSTNPRNEANSAIETETRGTLLNVACGSGYPFVLNHLIYPLCPSFGSCPTIDRDNDYTWVSRDQQIGPEDGLTGGYFIRVSKEEGEPEELPPLEEGGSKRTIKRYIYTIDTVSLVVAGEKTMSPKEYEKYLKKKGVDIPEEGSSKGCNPPDPWLLDKSAGYKDRLRYIGVVYKDTKDDLPFWSTFFADPPKRIMAYAQAQVYNHLAEDTFTQDWRVRLERASLLESFIEKKGKDTGMGKSNFASNFLNTVNNH